MGTISVYQNPHASGATHSFNQAELRKYFFRHEVLFRSPATKAELIAMINLDKTSGIECIFSIGGDGTAHTIAQELIGGQTKLLVMPGGTANDFAQELGTNSNLRKVAHVYHAQTTRKVDIIKINDRYLMTNGGIGIAQEVARQVNSYRKESMIFKEILKAAGKNTYSLLFMKHLLLSKFKLHNVYVESPDFPLLERRVSSPLILVNNQPKLAGRFPVAPFTRNNDGKFNVTIFAHDNRFDFIKAVSVFLRGGFPENDKKLIHFETDSLKLMSIGSGKLNFFGDGENFDEAQELNISLIPQALEVYSDQDAQNLCGGYSLDEIPHIL